MLEERNVKQEINELTGMVEKLVHEVQKRKQAERASSHPWAVLIGFVIVLLVVATAAGASYRIFKLVAGL
jgi:hypothetical protein